SPCPLSLCISAQVASREPTTSSHEVHIYPRGVELFIEAEKPRHHLTVEANKPPLPNGIGFFVIENPPTAPGRKGHHVVVRVCQSNLETLRGFAHILPLLS